jgi:transcription termination factor Rho
MHVENKTVKTIKELTKIPTYFEKTKEDYVSTYNMKLKNETEQGIEYAVLPLLPKSFFMLRYICSKFQNQKQFSFISPKKNQVFNKKK